MRLKSSGQPPAGKNDLEDVADFASQEPNSASSLSANSRKLNKIASTRPSANFTPQIAGHNTGATGFVDPGTQLEKGKSRDNTVHQQNEEVSHLTVSKEAISQFH